ncbi:hypothetical protein NP233_g11894 [Leucocoprinus birnbaumii]|uniref:Uncharacterized protein n=1 Tax=Leucocoprinus birnbaumii TaxID=56174 RepID=A0AAD5YQH2_9AGAR|nr:hypothetical protein NP233_g11894 [Leucocoprinus birnbaumii]
MLAKGHVQPHHNNVPRRRQRTQSPHDASVHVKSQSSPVPIPEWGSRKAQASPLRRMPIDDSTDWTRSSASGTTTEEDRGERPSPRTPVTTPSEAACLPDAALLDGNKPQHLTAFEEHQSPGFLQESTFDNEPTSPFGILLPGAPPTTLPPLATSKAYALSNSAGQPRVSTDGARGYLEPRATNVPRRLSRAQKDKERSRRRCLQEVVVGSRVYIAFDLTTGSDGGGFDDEDGRGDRGENLTLEERKERGWLWDSDGEQDFSGVIRVRVGRKHGDVQRRARVFGKRRGAETEKEELEMTIGFEQSQSHDDSGISALTDLQLGAAASFLVDHRRTGNGSGKVLLMVPPSRPVEALSIALFALSLPSTSSDQPDSPSYLSQLRFLPGIMDLEQSQDVDVGDIANPEPSSDDHSDREINLRYTLIQLALWHLHDLPVPTSSIDETTGLKLEWRGALSFEGVERLESLVLSR